MSYVVAPFAALALLLAMEGVSAAKTQGALIAAGEQAAADSSATAASVVSALPLPDPGVVSRAAVARVRICHISRHPRDGMPASEHACPLFIAEASPGPESTAARPD